MVSLSSQLVVVVVVTAMESAPEQATEESKLERNLRGLFREAVSRVLIQVRKR